MIRKIKIVLFLLGFGALAGGLAGWMIYAWIEKGYAPVDTIGGRSSIGAAITTSLLIILFSVAAVGSLLGGVAAIFADLSDAEDEQEAPEHPSKLQSAPRRRARRKRASPER